MKRKKAFCAVLASLAILASHDVYAGGDIKIGADTSGTFGQKLSGPSSTTSSDVNSGTSMVLEGFTEIDKNMDVGIGLEWQSGRALTKSFGGTFNFMPVYLFMRMHPAELGSFSPYLPLHGAADRLFTHAAGPGDPVYLDGDRRDRRIRFCCYVL